MTSPIPGTTFAGSSVTFTWTPNTTSVTKWALEGGSALGVGDLFNDGGTLGTNTTFTATNLPTDGRTIYIQLWYLANGSWDVAQVQYTAATTLTPPSMTTPTPGAIFPGASVTFAWSANGTPVTQWALQGGSASGAGDLFSDGGTLGTNTTFAATNLPADGRTVYVQLSYLTGGAWEVIEYQYTAATTLTPPSMTTPTPGAIFPGASVTFAWSANGTPVTQWALQGGSASGAGDLFSDGGTLGTNTTFTATNLPTDGRTVYVQLFYLTGGSWEVIEYQYSAAGSLTPPSMTTPAPGTSFLGSSVTFTWMPNTTPVTQWALQGGSTSGAGDLFSDGGTLGTNTTFTATNLPADGRTVYVQLSYLTGGAWEVIEYQYTAATTLTPPSMTTPAPGAIFPGASVTFAWSANGTPVTQWALQGGSASGAGDLFSDSGTLGTNTTFTATNLPTDGRTVYVQLFYLTGGSWEVIEYQYSAAGSLTPPSMTTPAPGTSFLGSSVTFTWTPNTTPVTQWALQGGSTSGAGDLFSDGGTLGTNTTFTATNLPADGRTVYVQLSYLTGGAWEVIEYQYTAATTLTPPSMTTPAPGAIFPGASVTFAWSANGTPVTKWALEGGSALGVGDLFNDGGTLGTNTTFTATNLPTDGRTIYIQLWYLANGSWDVAQVQYTAATTLTPPSMTTPAPGAIFPGASVTFAWSANGTPVTQWALQGGSTSGAGDLFSDGGTLGTNTTFTATNLPADGRTVYVQLSYLTGGAWEVIEYQYTAATTLTPPSMTTPAPGAIFPGASVTFAWSANGTPVTKWALEGGSALGVGDLFNDGGTLGTNTTFTATNLPTDGRTIYIQLWYLANGSWDVAQVQYTAALSGIAISSPVESALLTSGNLTVQATASGFPSNWGVEFVVDGDEVNSVTDFFAPFELPLTNLSLAEHNVTVYMVDQNSIRQPANTASVEFGIGDYYVGFGDSITYGVGDDLASDDVSNDGRNTGGGFTPILNDLLTNAKGYPHTVENETIPGYEAGDGLAVINNALTVHPDSQYFLILFGTNDSTPPMAVPSGLDLHPGDGGYPGSFKDNMKQIIDAVKATGKYPLLSKVPIRYADCSIIGQCNSYPNPATAQANLDIQEYNLVVEQLILENNLEFDPINLPGNLLTAPDLYTYFEGTGLDGLGKSPEFYDWLHPNGVGYQALSNLWLNALTQ